MPVFSARILSKDGAVVAEAVEVWMDVVRRDHWEEWYGSFDIALDQQEVCPIALERMRAPLRAPCTPRSRERIASRAPCSRRTSGWLRCSLTHTSHPA